MSYLNWKVGDKVVCIKKGAWSALASGEIGPATGGIYTIRTIDANPEGVFLRFHEIVNPILNHGEKFCECQFWAPRFRPVQTRKTDISIFHRIRLNPSIRIREDA